MNNIVVDMTSITRYNEECRGYGGNMLEPYEKGEYVSFDAVVDILAKHGITVRSAETVENEKFEAEMVAKYGEGWRV